MNIDTFKAIVVTDDKENVKRVFKRRSDFISSYRNGNYRRPKDFDYVYEFTSAGRSLAMSVKDYVAKVPEKKINTGTMQVYFDKNGMVDFTHPYYLRNGDHVVLELPKTFKATMRIDGFEWSNRTADLNLTLTDSMHFIMKDFVGKKFCASKSFINKIIKAMTASNTVTSTWRLRKIGQRYTIELLEV